MIDRARDIAGGEPLRTPIESYSSVPTLVERMKQDVLGGVVIGVVLTAATVVLAPMLAKRASERAVEIGKKYLNRNKK